MKYNSKKIRVFLVYILSILFTTLVAKLIISYQEDSYILFSVFGNNFIIDKIFLIGILASIYASFYFMFIGNIGLKKIFRVILDDEPSNSSPRDEFQGESDSESTFNKLRDDFLNKLSEREQEIKALAKELYPGITLHNTLKEFDEMENSLEEERDVISKRSGVNLLIGMFSGVIAVFLLFHNASPQDSNEALTLVGLLRQSIPAIFIQGLSFFFLSLYKSGLADVKYYRNEVTNIQYSKISLLAVMLNEDKETVSEIAKVFSYKDCNQVNPRENIALTSTSNTKDLSPLVKQLEKLVSTLEKK